MENLLHYIRSLTDFSDESWEKLLPCLSRKQFKKRELLLREGEVCRYLFYIDQGYCKSYYIMDGLVRNTAFYFENEIATNVDSFGSGKKSLYFIEACETLTAILFDKKKLWAAAAHCSEIESLGRKCIRRFAAKQQEFSNLFQLYSPRERLEYIETHYPEMIQRIPLTQLGSFLGVARETLSRIRSRRRPS